jgi:hypothetical protein
MDEARRLAAMSISLTIIYDKFEITDRRHVRLKYELVLSRQMHFPSRTKGVYLFS